MRWLYTFGLYLLVPVILVRLWLRGRKNPAYRERIQERFGFFSPLAERPRIWLHAVSVGETIAASPLIKKILLRYPEHRLLVTTTTPTGSAQLRRLFPDDVEHLYFPYDLPDVIKRFFKHVRPDILIVMETELWPNLSRHCAQKQIPLLISNARLSPRSFTGYKKFISLTRSVLADISMVSPQSEADAERFRQLGADHQKVSICGNLKFDLKIPIEVSETGEALKHLIGNRPTWIAASTHVGEDEQVLSAHREILALHPGALLILVPRHPERFDAVAKLCEENDFTFARRSRNSQPENHCQIYLGDTMGELLQLYAAADIAFVGGSLVATGGHNPLEPAALGLPVLSGPHVFNFTAIVAALTEENAIRIVEDSQALGAALIRLFEQPESRSEMGDAGRQLVERNRGAADCLMERISTLLQEK